MDAIEDPSDNNQEAPVNKAEPGASTPEDDMLSPLQMRAIALLAAGLTVLATAEELGVDRGTVHRWKRNPAFQEALDAAAEENFAQLRGVAHQVGLTALQALEAAITGAEYDRDRISAAQVVLDFNRRVN